MRKCLLCPVCKRRIMDTEDTVLSEIIVVSAEQKAARLADYYAKCWGCKNEIGIRKIK